MWIKPISTIFFIMLMLTGSGQSSSQQKKYWSVVEEKEWAEKHKSAPAWHGWLLYQGSDTSTHHFTSRIMDEWIFLKIRRTDLSLKEERQFKKTSSSRLGYYYVDAANDFVKIKDY